MNILMLHNRYVDYGGEDSVFKTEFDLLTESGHRVDSYIFDNRNINTVFDKISIASRIAFNKDSLTKINDQFKLKKYDIIHVHNFFPILSPSIHIYAKRNKIPIVQTIHNYRFFCSNGFFWRNNNSCQKCLQNNNWGVVHRCYKNSLIGSYYVKKFQNNSIHNKNWINSVTLFFVLSRYASNLFTLNGIPENKIYVKPNFTEELNNHSYKFNDNNNFLFVGRLDFTKGILKLIQYFRNISSSNLEVIGDGPLKNQINENKTKNIKLIGHISDKETLFSKYASSKALIFASESHESQPMTIIEAMSIGLPIICFKNNSIREMFGKDYPDELFFSNEKGLLKSINYLKEMKNLEKVSKYLIRQFKFFNKSNGLKNLLSGYYQAIDINKKLI